MANVCELFFLAARLLSCMPTRLSEVIGAGGVKLEKMGSCVASEFFA
jgi:hypothetical protein